MADRDDSVDFPPLRPIARQFHLSLVYNAVPDDGSSHMEGGRGMIQSRGHVFISYKTQDRDVAQRVRGALKLAIPDCSLWWDQNLQTGGQWNADLDEALQAAACVVVLWSKLSCTSPWVQQEAAVAKVLGVFAPATIDDCEIPPPYRGVQAAKLQRWDGREDDREFGELVRRVRQCLEAHAITIDSPRTDDPVFAGNITLKGKCPQLPPGQTLFLINARKDKPGFWPQVGHPITLTNGVWEGSVYVNSDTKVKLVTATPAAMALFKYYEKVAAASGYAAVDVLPGPPDIVEQDEVLVRCRESS
jgi:hypothetical protein